MTTYRLNKDVLRKAKELGHCPCDLKKVCPCDEFLNDDKCHCKAYEVVEE
ncbi:hypothetical protein HN419_06005 [Candidatus Woesearchaeota archaeon]|nr:hypothetical protein [Candidatus Woesearchaeota archaeon]MBT3537576.1 hypothetical protein [Candidatus Woesearchaeota archaeon]MBT4697414.1 hypothetical protein [Candidatus Woesearchaeota archaeon]MBT4716442.1 hypothetical protein [Candidatus Woesearchaeota archaeon]MBT7105245.1 hypothetical protein [Candidatus Woesearchaeota archaeon]